MTSTTKATGAQMAHAPIRMRLKALTLLSALGGLLFLPFLAAGSHQPVRSLAAFAVGVTTVAMLAAWLGLRCADAVGLPMPYLRRLDGIMYERVSLSRALVVTLAISLVLGVASVIVLRVIGAPTLPGDASTRALTTVFAAGPLEIVLHPGLMSTV